MKKSIVLALVFLFYFLMDSFFACAQNRKTNPFKMVEVPDSINLKLALITYKGYNDINSNKGMYILNLQNPKDLDFKDGIYSFRGFGPHFPKKIFIFNNGRLFIFENDGAFNPKAVIKEFVKCFDYLDLTNDQLIKYSKIITNYLEDEKGNNYGREIKNRP